MALDMKDLRAKITAETDCALEAESRASGKDRSEIVRDLLHVWSLEKIHAASVLHRLLQAEGLPGIGDGTSGNRRESQGAAGNRGQG